MTAIPGFYVAWGRWLDAEYGPGALHKVGHTGDLRRRLHDGSYVTGFPPDHWRYALTAETASRLDAARLEAAVLHVFAERRLPGRELVRAPLAEVRAAAERAAAVLGVGAAWRERPEYERGAPPDRPGDAAEPLLSAAELAALGAPVRRPAPPPPGDGAPPLETDPPGGTEEGDPPEDAEEGDPPEDLWDAPVSMAPTWPSPSAAGAAAPGPVEGRPYQLEAAAACLAELAARGRAVLQMACRTGKTYVAFLVAREYLRRGGRVLVLVPGLALLWQTLAKLDAYGLEAAALAVGSDARAPPAFASLRLGGRQTTGAAEIRAALAAAPAAGGAALVVATYQSSPQLPDAFDLVVFDECHRTCGGAEPRPFSHALLTFGRGARLCMTATPRYDAPVSMRDAALYGSVAYRYHMRSGIDAGHVNDFGLELVPLDAGAPDATAALAAAVAAAAARAAKTLVFCRSIRHAWALCRATRAAAPGAWAGLAHSRMGHEEVARALAAFAAAPPGAALFNCRLFQEGVEIPALDAVFFAAPRHSPRDIIQSLCRPLTRLPGKPPSRVFLPVALDPAAAPDAAANLGRFAAVVPVFDALMAEDPLLYEHVLDPAGVAYPLGCAPASSGLAYEPAALLAAARRAVRRGGGGGGGGERLLRAARVPWDIGFAELARVVAECGRYPKTTDTFAYGDARVNFGSFYRYVREAYAAWRRGEAQPLEAYQLRALEGLAGWDPYGIGGPYAWEESLAFLERWLAGHGGAPPPLNVNDGGYVGLDATPVERLSGALTCVNQGDGRDRARGGEAAPGSGFTIDPAKARDLDALCARWGLRWRKDRLPPPPGAARGSLVEGKGHAYAGRKTFIQEAHEAFKREWQTHGVDSSYIREHYPGFPAKHKHQERPDVWARRHEVVPPRWRKRGAQKKDADL